MLPLIPPQSPRPILHNFDYELFLVEEELEADRKKGLTPDELAREEKLREARSHAVVLEMLGDLPELDVKPPENVLFVCKLNPITRSDDLELIFSQCGEITACEIIKDWKTGASLQYAFIEFARKEDAERAYLKLNNVLVDERRIKVDFSQSVSKQWNEFRRRKLNKNKPPTAMPNTKSNVSAPQTTNTNAPTRPSLPSQSSSSSSSRPSDHRASTRSRSRSPHRSSRSSRDDRRSRSRSRDRDRDRDRSKERSSASRHHSSNRREEDRDYERRDRRRSRSSDRKHHHSSSSSHRDRDRDREKHSSSSRHRSRHSRSRSRSPRRRSRSRSRSPKRR